MNYPILYSFKRCPYAMRARMALKLTNIKCEIREVRLNNKPKHMLEVSPKGTVPVLILNDRTIEESMDVIEWALNKKDVLDINSSYIRGLKFFYVDKMEEVLKIALLKN